MELRIMTTFQVTLNVGELRLVSKALRGKLEKPEDIEAARVLQEKMIIDRHKQLSHLLTESQKAVLNLQNDGDVP